MNTPVITMIDYGGSNLRSAQKAFEFVGATVRVTADPDEVIRADKLVLPGVGAFGAGMAAMKARGLDEATCSAAIAGIPLLGICLGMQYLFDISEEMGEHQGLGLLSGRVIRFPTDDSRETGVRATLKVPHMGWNEILHTESNSLLAGVANGSHAYFVHSYYCDPANEQVTIARTGYGLHFASIVEKDNVFGIQFHPEKSQAVGLRILRNFVNM